MKSVEWEDIEIGEAFYFCGCEGFGVKVSDKKLFVIDSDQRHDAN